MDKDKFEINDEDLDFDLKPEDFEGDIGDEISFDGDDFTFLDELKEEEPNLENPDTYVDKFAYLMDSLTKSGDEEELEVREVISNRRIEIDADVDLSLDSVVGELEEANEYSEMDLNSAIPNIPTEELDEYILIKGMYSSAFKEHISNDRIVPRGEYPLAIEVEGNLILFKMIHPEPRTLYYLKTVFVGFDIKHVKDGISEDLDIYKFLGKTNIAV